MERKKIEKEYHNQKAVGKIDFLFYDTAFLKNLISDIEKFSLNLSYYFLCGFAPCVR